MDEKNKNGLSVLVPVLAALICIISSVAYIVFRISSDRMHQEKWQDYDECGI